MGTDGPEEPQEPTRRELAQFEARGVTPPEDRAAQIAIELAQLRNRDVQWRIGSRPKVGWTFIVMLLLQNLFVAALIGALAVAGHLASAAVAVSVISAGTLAETAVIVQIVVKWLFSDIDYR